MRTRAARLEYHVPVSQRVQFGVYTLMALSRYRDALVQWEGSERPLVYQPLVPRVLTACYLVVLLPTRDFGELSAISTMPWHFSCRFGPSILILLRSTEDLGLSCSRPAGHASFCQALCGHWN